MPMYRKSTNKRADARRFNKSKGRTRAANVMVMRGGFRL